MARAMSITPPSISAFLPNLLPNVPPMIFPTIDMINDTAPIINTGSTIGNFIIPNEAPTAKASRLVAIDNITTDIKLR